MSVKAVGIRQAVASVKGLDARTMWGIEAFSSVQ